MQHTVTGAGRIETRPAEVRVAIDVSRPMAQASNTADPGMSFRISGSAKAVMVRQIMRPAVKLQANVPAAPDPEIKPFKKSTD